MQLREQGISFVRFPIPDRSVPTSVEAAHRLWNALATRIRAGGSVGIHCRAGFGRSGLMVAGTLIHLGISAGEAWQRTAKARGLAVPDTERQREWLHEAQ